MFAYFFMHAFVMDKVGWLVGWLAARTAAAAAGRALNCTALLAGQMRAASKARDREATFFLSSIPFLLDITAAGIYTHSTRYYCDSRMPILLVMDFFILLPFYLH